jgi:UDP-N-acetylglucosamine acyltransferase
MSIHPLAVVSSEARIGRDVRIGPFCIVESDVTIGDGCILKSHAVIKSGTTLGSNNHVFESAVIGGPPQHTNAPERPGKIVIGSGNTLRENVTIHRALEEDHTTTIGDNNLLMINAHVAHNCRIGNNTILVGNTMLAGYVIVEDRACVGGGAAVHQFCRIGSLAMVGGQAHVVQDVPPFVTVDGLSSCVVGLNQIGLRRAGYMVADIRQLKAAYRVIYRNQLPWKEVLERLRTEFPEGPAAHFFEALSVTTRGIVSERRPPPGATVQLRREPEEQTTLRAKVG